MSILDVSNITFSFPSGFEALSGISFSIEEGKLTIIAGKNGSGKTVLMKHLNGLLIPDRGEITFRELSTRKHGDRVRRSVGLVFQDSESCIVGQTVWDDLMFGPENLMHPKGKRETEGEIILKKLGLWEKKDLPPRFLSGGEKKKLTIAGILIMEPEIIILDEPFVGLDYPGVREILEILLSLIEDKRTVIVITHDLEKILAHGERLIIIDNGRVTADGKPEDLLEKLTKYGIRRPSEKKLEDMTWLIS